MRDDYFIPRKGSRGGGRDRHERANPMKELAISVILVAAQDLLYRGDACGAQDNRRTAETFYFSHSPLARATRRHWFMQAGYTVEYMKRKIRHLEEKVKILETPSLEPPF